MTRTVMTVALVLAVVGFAEAAPPIQRDYDHEVSTESFVLKFDMSEKEQNEAQSVEVYVSTDLGKTYQLTATVPPDQTKVTFKPPRGGIYWFSIIVIDKKGQSDPVSPYASSPVLRILVTRKAS